MVSTSENESSPVLRRRSPPASSSRLRAGSKKSSMSEHAQQIAARESPRTTKLYDRTSDAISLDEIERIVI